MRYQVLVAITLMLALGTPGASAMSSGDRAGIRSGALVALDDEPDQVLQGDGGKSLSEAVEQVRRQTGGRILSAETKLEGGREVHHIKVLTEDGKVKTYKVQGRKRGD